MLAHVNYLLLPENKIEIFLTAVPPSSKNKNLTQIQVTYISNLI